VRKRERGRGSERENERGKGRRMREGRMTPDSQSGYYARWHHHLHYHYCCL
jgi:hypothetical protein